MDPDSSEADTLSTQNKQHISLLMSRCLFDFCTFHNLRMKQRHNITFEKFLVPVLQGQKTEIAA